MHMHDLLSRKICCSCFKLFVKYVSVGKLLRHAQQQCRSLLQLPCPGRAIMA
jgi:hypothetical protein